MSARFSSFREISFLSSMFKFFTRPLGWLFYRYYLHWRLKRLYHHHHHRHHHHHHHCYSYCHRQRIFKKSLSVVWYKFLHLVFPFRCLQKFPVSFLKCDIAIPSIHCAVVASIIEHRDANLSVMKFLKCLVSCATEKVRQRFYFFLWPFCVSQHSGLGIRGIQ